MAEQVRLNITNVQLAEIQFTQSGSVPGWVKPYDTYYFYAGREGADYGGSYFMVMLEFSTESVNFLQADSLTLSLVTARKEEQKSNVGRISAILCDRKLTSTEAYYLQSEDDINNLDGAIAYVNCSEYPKVTDYVLPNTTVTYQFNGEVLANLKAGQKYYLILKRRIGLLNKSVTTGEGGYSEFRNPATSAQGYIELSYSNEATWPSKEEVMMLPENLEVIITENLTTQFQLRYRTDGSIFTHETLQWSHELYNENGELAENQALISNGTDGTFSFSGSIPENYSARIIAKWGSGAAQYELHSSILFIEQWPHLLDWVVGYNLGLLAPPVVNYCQGKRGFYYYLNPNNHDKTVVLPTPPEGKYFYNCIAQDELVPTIFYFCSSDKPFVYEPIEKYTMFAEGAEAQICSCRPSKEFEWSLPSTVGQDKKLSLVVIWTDTNLMDESGKIHVRPYIPQPYYGQEE